MSKSVTTVRLPDERLILLKVIAGYESKTFTDIFSELVEEYIERHRETLELLNIPGFVEECKKGLEEIKKVEANYYNREI
jgi:predicted CopG family antitoxin